ncbi:hypothetical protein [Psychrobacter sp. I-STPA10]|uniref:hypothetical protein n=1 Tax=Psychrobacter sp. I-STPA10 TaxID=2585769 RepID=UPI001E2E1D47|nr:hypothetical protein [Psychrobacter sp. I-STPA10]
MLPLDELQLWQKLDSAYGDAETLPELILTLTKTEDSDVADEIVWEIIYHQGSVYQSTLATVPYLVKIAQETTNVDLKMNLVLSLGTLLTGFDSTTDISVFFQDNSEAHNSNNNEGSTDKKTQQQITTAFMQAIVDFKALVNDTFTMATALDDVSKIYFLVSYLVSMGQHQAAALFNVCSDSDEFIVACPNCEQETYLWNEEDGLKVYKTDPVCTNIDYSTDIELSNSDSNSNLVWLENAIDRIEIETLKPLMPYFKGSIICPHCQQSILVFHGLLNAYGSSYPPCPHEPKW